MNNEAGTGFGNGREDFTIHDANTHLPSCSAPAPNGAVKGCSVYLSQRQQKSIRKCGVFCHMSSKEGKSVFFGFAHTKAAMTLVPVYTRAAMTLVPVG
jgi:hypothetical protein